ncbi:hypothetical protein G6514_002072 [Epicoccum nigrum]|nr:hypothetical protein G6514_002072 [Epicoccum nigrum]
MPYVPFQSKYGPNWEDLEDDDLSVFIKRDEIPETVTAIEKPDQDGSDEDDEYEEAGISAAEGMHEAGLSQISTSDSFPEDEDLPTSLNLAKRKHFNEAWDICRACPAYKELSFDGFCYYTHIRVQYKTNWLEFKQCMGVSMNTPMLMKFSPLRQYLTMEYNDEGGCTIREGGKLINGPLFPHAEFAPPLNTDVSEEEQDEPQTPPKSPPCRPGFRDDRGFGEDGTVAHDMDSSTDDVEDEHVEGLYEYCPVIRFFCDSKSGVIHDVDPDSDDDVDDYARNTVDESTDSSAEDSYGDKLNKYLHQPESPVTSVSSAFSDSSEDGVCESDDVSTSQSEEDGDICVILNFAPSDTLQCIASIEKEQANPSRTPTTIGGSPITPPCLETSPNNKTTDNTPASTGDYESVHGGFVFDEDTQVVTVNSVGEVPAVNLPSLGALFDNESADHDQTEQLSEEAEVALEDSVPTIEIPSPVPVTVEADMPSSTDLSAAIIKSTDCTSPAHHAEDALTAHVDSVTPLIETAGFSPDPVLSQPPPATPLAWDAVCTTGFAMSSVPWLRIGVAAAGIVIDVASTLLRR